MKIIVVLVSILASITVQSQTNYIIDSTLINEYPFIYSTNNMINQLKKDPVLRNANWGFCLYDPLTEREIISKDAYDNYIPASTTKLISSESALRLLGEDFTWKTNIVYTGYVDYEGILQGNIYVLWNGDPTLGLKSIGSQSYSQLFEEAYQQMKILGIKKIEGKIIYESVVFKSEKKLYPFDSRMIEFNTYYSLIPTENQELTQEEIAYNEALEEEFIEAEPEEAELEELSLEDQIMQEIIASIEINNKLNNLEAIGTKNLSLASPPAYFTKLFKAYIGKRGVAVSGGYVQQNYLDLETEEPRYTLMEYQSPPLKDLVYFVNQRSSNPYAQHLIRTIGIFIGKRDTEYTSLQTVYNKLEDVNYYYNGLVFTDGSGLSYKHRVSPISQVKYLSTIMYKPYYETFYNSLPTAGVSGTLRNSFKTSVHNGSLHAKTGTLGQIPIKTLAGYITTSSGETLCFSLLINRYSGSVTSVKARMEKLLNTVY